MRDIDVKFNHLGMSDVANNSNSPVLQHLYRKGYILCHYEDVASFDPKKHEKDTGDLESFVDSYVFTPRSRQPAQREPVRSSHCC